jgi:type VI secretion system protein ImpF
VAGLTSQERLQPSLLDRLTDDAPTSQKESLDARVLSRQQLRAAVLRDLSWLFNTTCEEPDGSTDDVERLAMWRAADEARRSVANFGIPALSGATLASMDLPTLQEALRLSILRFEPRIDAATLAVEINNERSTGRQITSLRMVIRGQMWNQPVPLELLLSADVDVDTGQAAVRDMRA